MRKTPKSLRLHIGLFGRMNVGKSSFLNMICNQDVAITSPMPGTTTDIVEKIMELLPLGPVVFLDTAGIDDQSILGKERIRRTEQTLQRSDLAVIVVEPQIWSEHEDYLLKRVKEENLPFIIVINKADLTTPSEKFIELIKEKTNNFLICSSLTKDNNKYVERFKELLFNICPEEFLHSLPLVSDLVPAGKIAVLIVPIDLQAPKGRLILPQVQAIRDLLDADAAVLVVKEREYAYLLSQLKEKPCLAVCDSQVVLKMVADTPKDIACTTFSILFARYKGDLLKLVQGVKAIDNLKPNARVLIAEACSHHPIEDDIGRVKIPRWLRSYLGIPIDFRVCSGKDYPDDLNKYSLIIHCGGCMLTRRQMLFRIHQAQQAKVPITNYGLCISKVQGVLQRVLSPFPAALDILSRREN